MKGSAIMMIYNSATDSIVSIARGRGSKADTKAGAWRFLLAQMAIPSLVPAPQNAPGTEYFCYYDISKRTWNRDAIGVVEYRQQRDEQRAEKILRGSGLWARDEAEAEADRLTRDQLRWSDAEWPYRSSQSRWAGGEHSISIRISDVASAVGGSVRAWSANGKWSGTNSYATLYVTARAIQCFPALLAGGLVVLDAEPVGPREYKMLWIEQGRGFALNAVAGFYLRGHHVRGGSLESARRRVRRERERTISARLAARLLKQKRMWALSRVFVAPADSRRVGNCPAGTEQMVRRLCAEVGGEIGAMRADELLRRRDDVYTRRAVDAAIVRFFSLRATRQQSA